MNRYAFDGTKPIKTKGGVTIATDYTQIVHGGRGAYAEFDDNQILITQLHIPIEQSWRLSNPHAYYIEYRTIDNVKVYLQLRTVSYANYRYGFYYISPIKLQGFIVVGKYHTETAIERGERLMPIERGQL